MHKSPNYSYFNQSFKLIPMHVQLNLPRQGNYNSFECKTTYVYSNFKPNQVKHLSRAIRDQKHQSTSDYWKNPSTYKGKHTKE